MDNPLDEHSKSRAPGTTGCAARQKFGLALMAAALLGLAASGTTALAQKGYDFTQIAALGDPAPGGGVFVNDFEPNGLNNRGDILFGADVSTGGEGIFLSSKGPI